MSESAIEWTDKTWNPVIGCQRVSEGCRNCYAEVMARRVVLMSRARDVVSPYEGTLREDAAGEPRPLWSGVVKCLPERLGDPLRWRRPARVFVNSMSDLFHESVPDEFIAAVFGVMAACQQHTFQVLTKRPTRAASWFAWADRLRGERAWMLCRVKMLAHVEPPSDRFGPQTPTPWPLPNVWLGVSVEDQATADERIPHLLDCPAAVRFVSYEPALGPLAWERWLPAGRYYMVRCERCGWAGSSGMCGEARNFDDADIVCPGCNEIFGGEELPGLGWVIVGGESGRGARPFDVAWARATVRACEKARVPVFVKQLGFRAEDPINGIAGAGLDVPAEALPLVSRRLRDRKGGDPSEWPEDLRVREYPEVQP